MEYRGYRLSPEDVLKIIRLRDEEGLSFETIRKRYSVTEPTIRAAYWAGKARLKEKRPNGKA